MSTGSGEHHATVILSKSSHVTFTVGFLLLVVGGIVSCAIWMTKISDDTGSIRADMRAMVKTADDHESRIRALESRK